MCLCVWLRSHLQAEQVLTRDLCFLYNFFQVLFWSKKKSRDLERIDVKTPGEPANLVFCRPPPYLPILWASSNPCEWNSAFALLVFSSVEIRPSSVVLRTTKQKKGELPEPSMTWINTQTGLHKHRVLVSTSSVICFWPGRHPRRLSPRGSGVVMTASRNCKRLPWRTHLVPERIPGFEFDISNPRRLVSESPPSLLLSYNVEIPKGRGEKKTWPCTLEPLHQTMQRTPQKETRCNSAALWLNNNLDGNWLDFSYKAGF